MEPNPTSEYWRGWADARIRAFDQAVEDLREEMRRNREFSEQQFERFRLENASHARNLARIAGIGIGLAVLATPLLQLLFSIIFRATTNRGPMP